MFHYFKLNFWIFPDPHKLMIDLNLSLAQIEIVGSMNQC